MLYSNSMSSVTYYTIIVIICTVRFVSLFFVPYNVIFKNESSNVMGAKDTKSKYKYYYLEI